jgi:signal transduction histidine kinase
MPGCRRPGLRAVSLAAWSHLSSKGRVVVIRRLPGTAGSRAPAGGDLPLALMRRVAVPACVAVLVLVTAGVGAAMAARPPQVIAAAAVLHAVVLGGIGWKVADRSGAAAAEVIGLPAAGLAGAALTGLLPDAPGYCVMFLVLIAVGMSRPFASALVTGLVVFAATNLAFLLAGKASAAGVAGVDVGAAFFFTVGVFTRSARISRDKASAAQARAEQLLAQLRASQAAQAEAAALTERARLAREIHDILAHALSGLVLALDTAELLGQQGSGDAAAVTGMLEQVSRAQRIARDGLAETRRAVSALRGDELPGPALLDRLVRQTSEATGIHASLAVHGEQRPLPPETALALYRTAQEALINTAKYAGRGGTAALRLSYRPDDVELVIEDTRPADAAPLRPAGLTFGGYGLTGMRERAELLGGRLTAGPAGQGFRVGLWLPARPERQAAVPETAGPL